MVIYSTNVYSASKALSAAAIASLHGRTMNRTPDQESVFRGAKACIVLTALNRPPSKLYR